MQCVLASVSRVARGGDAGGASRAAAGEHGRRSGCVHARPELVGPSPGDPRALALQSKTRVDGRTSAGGSRRGGKRRG